MSTPNLPPLSILGPLQVMQDGAAVAIARPRQRSVLAYLLLRAGQVVPVSALVDAVWGERVPATARSQVQADIASIRKALPARWAARLETVAAGYRFSAGPADVDALAFAEGVRTAVASADEVAITVLRASLALWRGPALCDIDAPFVEAARAHLQEQRLVGYERLIDAELRRGGEAVVADVLAELVRTEPLRERLHEQLMIVYYRTGRRVEALAVARRLRRRLADECGLDPSTAVQDIERRILRDDPQLLAAPGAEQARAAAVPRELPAATADFVGRTDHLAELAAALAPGGTAPLVIIAGPAGAGKTTLAVRAAHAAAADYPDGQIFVRLHAASAHPVSTVDALRHLLRALGVDDARLPAGADECAARLRTLLASRRVLLVLDDIGDAEQVSQLLPGSAGCAVLMTGRSRLVYPPGVRLVELSGFSDAEAAEFLTVATGRPTAAEQDAVAEVVRLCRHLPLALRVVGGQLRAYPHRSVGDMASRLRNERHRLAVLTHGDLDVGASIGASVAALAEVDQRVLAGLAVAGLPGTAAWLAAWREELPEPAAAASLDRLTGRYLVSPGTGPAFSCHDLVRLWLREQLTAADRRRIAEATFAAYHDLALTTRAALAPQMRVAPGQPSGRLPAQPDALLPLLDAEIDNFVLVVQQAAAEHRTELVWQLSYLLFGYFDRGRHLANAVTITECAVRSARHAGDLDAQRIMSGHHAATCNMARRHEEALESLRTVLELAEESGVPRARMVGHAGLARTLRQLGRLPEAIVHYRAAARLADERSDAQAQTVLLHNLGAAYADLGELPAASTALKTAQRLARSRSDTGMQARAAHTLGEVAAARGDLAEALELTAASRRMAGRTGHQELEAQAAQSLGVLHHQRGDHDRAIEALLDSLTLYSRTGAETGLITTLRALAAAYHDAADPDRYRDYAHRALLLCRDIPS